MNTAAKSQMRLLNFHFLYLLLLNILAISPTTLVTSVLSTYIVYRYNGSASQVSVISSLLMLSMIFCRPFTGFIVDRWGRKVTLIISLSVIALMNFSLLIPMSIKGLGIFRLVMGLPFALNTTAINTLCADIIPEEHRSKGFSISSIVTTLAAMVAAPNLAFALLGDNNFNLLFITAGTFGILMVIAVIFMPLVDIRNPDEKFSFSSIVEKKVIWLAIVTGLSFVGWSGLLTFGPLYSKEIGIANSGSFLLSFGCGLLLSRWLSGFIVDLKNPKRAAMLALGLVLLGNVLIGVWNTQYGFFLGMGILGAGYGLSFATFSPMAINLVEPTRRGACNATLIIMQDVGVFIGFYLFGWTAQKFGSYSYSYLVNGLLILFPVGIFLLISLPDYLRKLEIHD